MGEAAARRKWGPLSESTTSSSTATASSSSGGSSSSSSYYYYSEGSGTTYTDSHTRSRLSSSSSSSTASSAATSSAGASDTASTFSAASRSDNASIHNNSESVPRKHASTSSSDDAAETLASSSDALMTLSSIHKKSGKAVTNGGGSAASTHASTSSAAVVATTTSNGVTVDDADALVPLPGGSGGVATPSSVASSSGSRRLALRGTNTVPAVQQPGSPLTTAATPASPYHFSEEELARQPWTTVDFEATTHTTEEEGGHLAESRAADVLATIHTVPIAVPPPPEEAQRCRREGGLPYPSHLTFRIVPGAAKTGGNNSSSDSIGVAAAVAKDGSKKGGDNTAKESSRTVEGRVKKAVCDSCCWGVHARNKREAQQRSAEERAAARQRSYHAQLHSHHVPLVNFRTTRDATVNLVDGDNTLPTVEEAAGLRHYKEDMQGTEENPKKLEKAMRRRRRPASGLHLKTKYAYGRRAGGGPRGIGESAFLREGDPKRFWVAQLHERSHVHLEPIVTE